MKKWPLFVQVSLTLIGLLILVATAQAASGEIVVLISAGPTLTGQLYYYGIAPEDPGMVISANASGDMLYNESGSFASPPTNINPGSDGWAGIKTPAISIRNSTGTVLLGDSSYTGTTAALTAGYAYYEGNGETFIP